MVCCIVVLSLSPWCNVMYSICRPLICGKLPHFFLPFLATCYASVREGVPFLQDVALEIFPL